MLKGVSRLSPFLAGALCLTAVYLSFRPSFTFWALSNGADLHGPLRFVWILFGLGVFLHYLIRSAPDENRIASDGRLPGGGGRVAFLLVLSGIAAFVLFFVLRSHNLYYGDGWLLTTFLERDGDPVHFRPGWGTIIIHRYLYRFLDAAGIGNGQVLSFTILSSLAGTVYIYLSYIVSGLLVRHMRPGEERGGVLLGMGVLLTTGAMQLYFGHVENYSLAHLFVFAFLVTGLRAVLEGKSRLLPFLFFLLAVFSHWVTALILPALLFLPARAERPNFSRAALILSLLAAAGIFIAAPTLSQFRHHTATVPWSAAGHPCPFGILSPTHLLFVLNLVILLTPVPFILLLTTGRHGPTPNAPIRNAGRMIGITALLLFAFSFVTRPYLGPRDWDLFSFFAFPAALFSFYLLLARPGGRNMVRTAGLTLGTGVFLLFPWIQGNADPEQVAERTTRFVLKSPHNWVGEDPGIVSLAWVMWERGDREAAYHLFEETVRYRPDSRIAQSNLGMLYWNSGRYEEARTHLEAAIALDPDLDPPLYYLGAAMFHLQEDDMGERHFREFLRKVPGNPSAAGYLGRILMIRGEWAEAKEYLLLAGHVLSRDADLNCWLARACVNLGETDEAREYLAKALEIDPNHKETRVILGNMEKRERPNRTYGRPRLE